MISRSSSSVKQHATDSSTAMMEEMGKLSLASSVVKSCTFHFGQTAVKQSNSFGRGTKSGHDRLRIKNVSLNHNPDSCT